MAFRCHPTGHVTNAGEAAKKPKRLGMWNYRSYTSISTGEATAKRPLGSCGGAASTLFCGLATFVGVSPRITAMREGVAKRIEVVCWICRGGGEIDVIADSQFRIRFVFVSYSFRIRFVFEGESKDCAGERLGNVEWSFLYKRRGAASTLCAAAAHKRGGFWYNSPLRTQMKGGI